MPIDNALTPEGQNALGAAFGYYPHLRRNRTVQDPQAALDMPVQFLRGRLATTAGTPSDVLNALRSPMPMEAFGDVDYGPQTQVPYGTQDLLQRLPLAPQGPAQQAAANLGSAVPLTPMEALQAARLARQAALAGKNLPVGLSIKAEGGMDFLKPGVAPQEQALRLAQQRAAQVGQSADPANRMLEQGFEPGWYHGTTGDITKFRTDLLGEATGAESAKKGFFFARDPQNPPASMLTKTNDPKSIEMLKKLGIPEEEIAKLNTVSMQGHGAETASGYAQIGGAREYKEAMRKAKAAEKRGNWDEYEKQMQIAEDSSIKQSNYVQGLVAKYGDARDEMLNSIQNSLYNKTLPQAEAEALDAKVKQLMPYGWYNSYSQPQLEGLKKEIVKIVGAEAAAPALKQIDKFKSVKAERALAENTQEGGNVMPIALRYKNPMVHDFGGNTYRDQTYSDLVDQALRGGHDALILKNTFDPGAGPSKLIDVGVVFSPDQIRSRFAAFDPLRKTAATAAAAGLAAPDLLAKEQQKPRNQLRPTR
jgi:hypothetical protein